MDGVRNNDAKENDESDPKDIARKLLSLARAQTACNDCEDVPSRTSDVGVGGWSLQKLQAARLCSAPEVLKSCLEELRKAATSDRHEVGAALFADLDILKPPTVLEPYLSSSAGAAPVRFVSEEVAAFFTKVFHAICLCCPDAQIQLAGWDLFHGHMFASTGAAEGDLGILFHAKEHPLEFTMRKDAILPVGHLGAGGDADPRNGTKISITDHNFPLRNFLWLLSTNCVYIIRSSVREDGAPSSTQLLARGCERFFTVDESLFGDFQVGSIYHFPGAFSADVYDPSVPAGLQEQGTLALCAVKQQDSWLDTVMVPCKTPPDVPLLRALRNGGTAAALEVIKGFGDDEDVVEVAEVLQRSSTASARLRRLLAHLQGSQLHDLIAAVNEQIQIRRESRAHQKNQETARTVDVMVERGFDSAHAFAALQLVDCNQFRAEGLLRVAYPQYRDVDLDPDSLQDSYDLNLAHKALYSDDWMQQNAVLALRALRRWREAGSPCLGLEFEVQKIAKQQQEAFHKLCSDRLDNLLNQTSQESNEEGEPLQKQSRKASVTENHSGEASPSGSGGYSSQSNVVPVASKAISQNHASTSDFNQSGPRCCSTHELIFKRQSSAASLSEEEHQHIRALECASEGDAWLVLVGGETGSIMRADLKGQRPGKYLAGHCSIQNIGKTYARLVDFFGRDRVIVICQLKETLDWLRAASVSEESCTKLAGHERFLNMLRERLAAIEIDCARLIADGGADYDFDHCHAGTLLRVLRGEKPHDEGKVVPKVGVKSVMLVVNSHGNTHPSTGAAQHALHSDEWYVHFPYPVPDEEDGLYDVVSHEGFQDPHPDWDWGRPKYRWRLYAQMLFQAYHDMLSRTPRRKLVLLYQFCTSGGAANFLWKESYQRYCRTQDWPVYLMVTSGNYEPALGGFLDIWTQELCKALHTEASSSAGSTEASSSAGSTGTISMGDLFARAEARYWEENPDIRIHNEAMLASMATPPRKGSGDSQNGLEDRSPRTMGTIRSFSGRLLDHDDANDHLMTTLDVREILNNSRA